MEYTHAILHQAGLPKNLWAEAICFSVWLKNCTLTKALRNITPFERLYGQKPNFARVLEWGQQVWVHNSAGSKLDTCRLQAQWVGYDADSTHAHCIYWPGKNTVSVEHDVKFVPPTITINTLPPSYASTMAPAQALPAPPPVPAPAPGPVLVAPVPIPILAQQPVAQAQTPAPPSRTSSAPPHIFHPTPPSTTLFPSSAPPLTLFFFFFFFLNLNLYSMVHTMWYRGSCVSTTCYA